MSSTARGSRPSVTATSTLAHTSSGGGTARPPTAGRMARARRVCSKTMTSSSGSDTLRGERERQVHKNIFSTSH
eukprot:4262623-Prymnesium_polylepis.1